MRIIVSGGGTGGHIYPAISIIEELVKRDPTNEILYVGTENGLEKTIVTEQGIDFKSIRVKGLPRKLNINSIKAAKELMIGLRQARKIVKEFKPNVVIGTGGFVSGPILYQAAKTNAYTVFHEQNSYPGITNRILSRYVDTYFVTFKESIKYFKFPERAVVTGNPIRNRFENIDAIKGDAYRHFGFDPSKKTLFSFGGSNGAKSLNDAMPFVIEQLKTNKDYQLIHICGKRNYDDFMENIGDISQFGNIKVLPYMNEIQLAYGVSDLLITSSGAITLAEISSMSMPSILIPKAYTTENHQEHNARVYEKNGASRLILEKDLNGKLLYETIEDILSDEKERLNMAVASGKLAMPNAAKHIVDEIYKNRW